MRETMAQRVNLMKGYQMDFGIPSMKFSRLSLPTTAYICMSIFH